ncbi:PREDICTED: uncharacterized protein LOC106809881 [Priapulus caudatus]|uniref:Uncharacterized protein LOC106809881 n=1 Tax=Priapulus caudatus TaxID=37621 RepID=A0ABM1E8T2_PRICU|nr:PREDICTED: uncharacterized protein LOC106809881 [Priapulus caudatus]
MRRHSQYDRPSLHHSRLLALASCRNHTAQNTWIRKRWAGSCSDDGGCMDLRLTLIQIRFSPVSVHFRHTDAFQGVGVFVFNILLNNELMDELGRISSGETRNATTDEGLPIEYRLADKEE